MDFQNMLCYCADLAQHNERSWFHEHHDRYDEARHDFRALLERLRFTIAEHAPALADDILYLPADRWTFRIPRDMRMNRDQPPYNPSFRAYISPDRKDWRPVGYFLSIAPGDCVFGTGIWNPDTKQQARLRAYLALNWEELTDILLRGGLTLEGEPRKTLPREYPPEHPAAQWLRLRSWMTVAKLDDAVQGSFDDYCSRIAELLARMEPLRQYLLDAANHS